MNQRVLLTVSLGLSLAFSSNINKLKATDTILAQTSSRAEFLTVEILENATYQLPNYGQITLRNGVYQSQTTPSLSVKMSNKIALGNFNRDSVADAATILKVTQGTAKPSFYLAVVVEQNGAASNVELTQLSINGNNWWSLGFEAFGEDGFLMDNLQAVASEVFKTCGGLKLQSQDSYAYPSWLSFVV